MGGDVEDEVVVPERDEVLVAVAPADEVVGPVEEV